MSGTTMPIHAAMHPPHASVVSPTPPLTHRIALILSPQVSYEEHRHEFFEDLARKLAEEVREVIRDARLDLLSTTAHFDATLDTKLKARMGGRWRG